jgi:hypothetical protein
MKRQRITFWIAIGIIAAMVMVFPPFMDLLGGQSRVGMTTATLPCVSAHQPSLVDQI